MGGQQTPDVHCLFLFKWYIYSLILKSARGSEMNGGRQTPNVHCLFLYRWYIHSFILNSAHGSEMNGGWQTPNVHCLFLYRFLHSHSAVMVLGSGPLYIYHFSAPQLT